MPDVDRPYRLPAATVLAPLAFVVANLLILWSGWATDYKLGIAILIGYAVLAASRLLRLNPTAPVLEWRAAAWLPVYLVGMGLIVYLSDFGPLENPLFPLWWDMVAVAGLSLAIYAWAQYVALPARAIERLVAAQPDEPLEPLEPFEPLVDAGPADGNGYGRRSWRRRRRGRAAARRRGSAAAPRGRRGPRAAPR